MNERIEELLVKKIDGELSDAEEKELAGWLAESEAHGRVLREFEAVRQRLTVLREEFHPDVKGRLQSVKKHKNGGYGLSQSGCVMLPSVFYS